MNMIFLKLNVFNDHDACHLINQVITKVKPCRTACSFYIDLRALMRQFNKNVNVLLVLT